MKSFKKKHIIIILLSVFIITSCRTKKTFNGTSTLPCPEYSTDPTEEKIKSKSKWRLVLYKDGKRVGGKSEKKKK